MFFRLFLLMTLIPILEIIFLLKIHGHLASFLGGGEALLVTIGSILLTGAIGANLARSQGFQVLRRMQEASARGQIPGEELVDGAMILVGGVLLLTPGYFTDVVGFILMIPVSRNALKGTVKRWLQNQVQRGHVHVAYYSSSPGTTNAPRHQHDPNVIDIDPISDRSDR
ncbi:FxsA family protein [Pseudobacteriovorax antillogorgiicola]|uniref:UPF0716 protein FxsA n=1 Tax=Pseudobacteriovorax antillogorgiicola TaxID=1513793 RepID=A0A1Y6C1U6_9BACT|nr:FxsA family protein [Pseudobacteriovorax antillogorgiicola]TCS52375.1 UPF0716 protein FxsA [Pseudobacteriovorax antillogorgiicola]SMF29316.1 UPF0716 protein FxsA [Pseudobacteriovorax antillogorgiicola]